MAPSRSRRSNPLPAQAKPASTDARNVEDRFHNVNYVIHFTNRATFVATFSGLKLGFSPLLFLLNAAVLAEPDFARVPDRPGRASGFRSTNLPKGQNRKVREEHQARLGPTNTIDLWCLSWLVYLHAR